MKHVWGRAVTPLAFYYAVTLALPLLNGAYRPAFRQHAAAVLTVPLALIVLFCALFYAARAVARRAGAPRRRPVWAREISSRER